MKSKIFRWISKIYIGMIFIYLYLPILIVVVYSFNKSSAGTAWMGITMDWYRKLFQDLNVIIAFKNSLVIAVASTVISSVVGATLDYINIVLEGRVW